MPARMSATRMVDMRLSNGRRATVLDWRANRLADALAKAAAGTRRRPQPQIEVLRSAEEAVRHAAALLGAVTHAANHCKVQATAPNGDIVVEERRDACAPPRRPMWRDAPKPALPPPADPVEQLDLSTSSDESSPQPPAHGKRPGAQRKSAQLVRASAAARVEDIGRGLQPRSGPSAAERMAALRRRVGARILRQASPVP